MKEQPTTAALREAYAWIVREDDERHRADNACAECVPDGPILVDGFRCAPHEARAYLHGSFTRLTALPPSAPPALDAERLAQALFMGDPKWFGPWADLLSEDMEIFRDRARDIAAEYARLQEQEPDFTDGEPDA